MSKQPGIADSNFRNFAILLLVITAALAPSLTGQNTKGSPQDVLTYHADNLRSGWFPSETQLTTSNVSPQSFGLLQVVQLDGRVDAEPLYVSQQPIEGQGTHNVVYVATENDSLYAIDATSGAILWQRSFGTAVPYQYKSNDDNVYPVMGILSTPVIDRQTNGIYLVADTYNGKQDFFRLYAVSLKSGKDLLKPVVIHYEEKLANGNTWHFNSQYQLQRPALLLSNGSIYIAFGSTADSTPSISRGTIVRFDEATLTQQSGQITDRRTQKSYPFYLSSIWQSGYGLAADENGDIYFSTGNSNPAIPSYSKSFNRPESVIHLSSDLSTLVDSFTTYNYFVLDQNDSDIGSGGMMLLPDQSGSFPHLAIAGGKDGRAFLLNRDNLGGYTSGGPDNVMQTVNMGNCWCGPASFTGSDGATHVLTGGNNGISSWKVVTSPSTQLVSETSTGNGPVYGWPDNGGAMPVVSSNGTTAGTGIVWFVQRPQSSSDQNPGTPVTLMAYSASDLTQQLVSIQAGTWVHAVNSNANIIPTVANGQVYVASNLQLQIFGLLTAKQKQNKVVLPPALRPSQPASVNCPPAASSLSAIGIAKASTHNFTGTVCRSSASDVQLALRKNASITVNLDNVFTTHRKVLLTPGRPLRVQVSVDEKGALHALRIAPSHAISSQTPADR